MLTLLIVFVLFSLIVCWACCAIAPVLVPDDEAPDPVDAFEHDVHAWFEQIGVVSDYQE
jgi:hypothetical protein